MNKNIYDKFLKACELLENHPALNPMGSGSFFSGNLVWWVNQICENGEIRDNHVKSSNPLVWINDDDERFKKYFDEFSEHADDEHILVPYRKIYGYSWIYDYCQFVGECSMFKYCPERNSFATKFDSRYPSMQCFNAYQGASGSGATFEEMVIEMAKDVVRKFGKWSFDDFLTTAEKKDHEENHIFIRVPVVDEVFGNCMTLENNENYMTVPDCYMNLRWWDYYRETKDYKKNWTGE